MSLFGSSSKSSATQIAETTNVNQTDNTAPQFGSLEALAYETAPFTFVQGGKGKKNIRIDYKPIDPGALGAFEQAAAVTMAALAAVEKNNALSLSLMQASAREQSKDIVNFAQAQGEPDKGFSQELIKNLIFGAVMLAGLVYA